MKKIGWQFFLAVFLVFLSALLYVIHYSIFKDAHHIFIYLLGDIAFVPIEVLLVTLIIHRLLSAREKMMRLQKLNMVIGAFFSEVGTELLTYLSDWDPNLDDIRNKLAVKSEWTDGDFAEVSRSLWDYTYSIDLQKVDLERLRMLLGSKIDFLIRLLENPALLEHETFTDLLWAVFHLAEELRARPSLAKLPQRDREHLAGDIERIYVLLVHQWLDYMRHLKDNFPYLFSLAMRTNPFDEEASPVLR